MTPRPAQNPRSRSTLVPIALLLVGLTSGLGVARTVWGGPPADAAEPPAEAPAEPAAEPSDDLVGADPTAISGDAPAADPVATDPAPVLDEDAASVPGASSLRAKME